MKTINNEKNKNNISAINYILDKFPNLPKASLFKALRNKDIKVNGKRINKDVIVNENDKIDIYISDIVLFNLPKKIEYIYDDENIAIVYKPQGILSNNEGKDIIEPTLDDLVKKEHPEYIICHRLDRNTSGLLIFAKNDDINQEIQSGFKNNCITKEYISYVSNYNFSKNEDTITNYIDINKKSGIAKIYDENNNKRNFKKITTSYKVLYTSKKRNYGIVKVLIHNGKTHQIRSVLSHINHPIIGDPKYGKNEINKAFKKYKQLLFAVRYKFNFNENSKLYYLKNKDILLDDNYYKNYIGDIYEKVTKC